MKKIIEKLIDSHALSHFASEILTDQNERDSEGLKERSENFLESTDSAIIRGLSIGLPDEYLGRIVVVFSRLSLLFYSGVLLENQDGDWAPQIYFHTGQIKEMNRQDNIKIKLPHLGPLKILKTPVNPIFFKLGLNYLPHRSDDSCFLIQPTPDFSFLLISRLAKPWLKDHLEKVQESLARSFV